MHSIESIDEADSEIINDGIQRILNNSIVDKSSVSQRVLLLMLLWGSFISDFPNDVLQAVFEGQFATRDTEEDEDVPEPWTRINISPLSWPLIYRLNYMALLVAFFEIDLFSGLAGKTSNSQNMITTEILEIVKDFISKCFAAIYQSQIDPLFNDTSIDLSAVKDHYSCDIEDLHNQSSHVSRYLLCRMSCETLLVCCTVKEDQAFLDNFLKLNEILKKLCMIMQSTTESSLMIDDSIVNILSFEGISVRITFLELSSFHPRDPTYPGSIEARALDFRFRMISAVYKLFEYGGDMNPQDSLELGTKSQQISIA
jgi:hypothetical protein